MSAPDWTEEARRLLEQSLTPVQQELNRLDWKQDLSSKTSRLHDHLSAMANSAGGGFLVFGVDPEGRRIGLDPERVPEIIQKLVNISRDGLEPACLIEHAVENSAPGSGRVLLFIRVPESPEKPVHIRGESIERSYIRTGGQTRKMTATDLRTVLRSTRIQRLEETPLHYPGAETLLERMRLEEVAQRLKIPLPEDPVRRQDLLVDLGFAVPSQGRLLPTHLGLLIAASDFSDVPGFEHFGLRITRYRGSGRLLADKDVFLSSGFIESLDRAVSEVVGLLPSSEVIERATRRQVPLYPQLTLREIIANAVIHRDYNRADSHVRIEIFDDRLEITNPGSLLPGMDVQRLLDQEPRARNEVLADKMRRLGFCEERGSGIDRAVFEVEVYGLPAVEFQDKPDSFKVILYAPRPYARMDWAGRMRTVYQHTCLHHVLGKDVTNASLRERLHLKKAQSQLVSILIRRTISAGQIKRADPKTSPRYMRYLPYWA